MSEWTREQRYQGIDDVPQSQLIELKQKVDASHYRQTYHIQPETGLLNDPNGLIFYNGTYYVSHQWFPLGAVHGLKYWFNYTSKDLVSFTPHGPILEPDTAYDSHGVYSGSAFEYNGQLYYMYTGNHRDSEWNRHSSQMLAKVDEYGDAVKFEKPVIPAPPTGYTQHFRDPNVFQKDGQYFMIIAAQNEQENACLLLYKMEEQVNEWAFVGEIATQLSNFGYMWECPDFFNLNQTDVLLFCPQGISPEGERFNNIYQSGYLLGTLDIQKPAFEHQDFKELDYGFDFYAPQTFLDKQGNRILIGWMGMPDTHYPTDDEGWAHCLTLPRVLTVEHGKLIQRPLPALQKLRHNEETAEGYANKFTTKLHPYEGLHYELIIDILENEASEVYFELRTSKQHSTLITYNKQSQRLTLDRSDSGALPEPVKGTTRSTILDTPLSQLQIFVDTSSIEIFCNNGERVLTSRIFPDEQATGIKTSTESGQVYLKFTKYELKDEK
ncbi:MULTISPECIES: sucrose-6-phosphate hydrolase [Staphylococcus]|uniref:sucrose-6-phosphate hydrolase n=1 Tax=Staphylococcus TaxID=1279 RepID=UPI0008A20A29|nr:MULTISPECIES: sucrose-6-phosphate hydrolase [Staphylococcus]ARB77380.1 sucrose-6-phosphate hydrolase [Staphylococcus lugdunensis]ARJ18493.1 sucrose-6-phosphate hydrolase [Staphylococcus lugdunensis]MBM7132551.1 sucrose-6-phosphate hydrolase [Staphylococcus lugdunensis]MCH8643187.1 sucrose-6-phosphate hydrolase [Staphylococcus lugdunensis]MCH8645387.1 sucrose-6-phosphate hydrolase [Staphylococcus lugdunensis]